MNDNISKYEGWLITIANTRLIFNRMEELEDMLDVHSIHSNGVKRSFSSHQRMRSAFRDLMVEVFEMTDYNVNLEVFLDDYKKAWAFYKDNLARRSSPETFPMDILNYCYSPNMADTVSKKRQDLISLALSQNVNVLVLLLIQMRALPGYDSKEGDPEDFPVVYEKVMQLLKEFTGTGMYEVLPVISEARMEERKTRLMLYHHVVSILNVYCSYASEKGLYEASETMKGLLYEIDLDGYWNECGGTAQMTHFWHFQHSESPASYFLTHWEKDAENYLKGIRYTVFCLDAEDGNLHLYMTHPESMRHRIEGRKFTDMDHVWYAMPKPTDDRPSELPLKRLLPSSVWLRDITLTRVTDEKVLSIYEKWLHKNCQVVKLYSDCEYKFFPSLHAVTETHLYISSEKEGEYYKVPREGLKDFRAIKIGDNVGTLLMNGQIYLAFDEQLLYILTTDDELRKYGIERVSLDF